MPVAGSMGLPAWVTGMLGSEASGWVLGSAAGGTHVTARGWALTASAIGAPASGMAPRGAALWREPFSGMSKVEDETS
jgi:hypothetical protein